LSTSVRVLLTEVSASRYGAGLLERHRGIELVSMQADASLRADDGSAVDRDHSGIEVAWSTSDLFEGDLLRPFFGLVRRTQTLRWFQSAAAGYEAPMFAELIRRGVAFTKSDVHSVPIPEYVLRAALDHFQEPERWAAAQAARRWETHEFAEVAGSRWVVVGFGSIGRQVARLALAFGAAVVGVRRHPDPDDTLASVVTPEALPEVLGDADVVVLCAPSNASTHHLVDAGFLDAMAQHALLINIGRGSLVDEAALVDALDAGSIGAAVLDVFATEPLPQDNPLWAHPRVRITPHNSGNGAGRDARQAALFDENLGRYLRGEPLRNLVTEADLDE
jgi:phosphoglycerate dehydrogenase-like enzyme